MDQSGAQRIAFNVPQHGQIVEIILHRKTLEPSLVQMPVQGRIINIDSAEKALF